VESLDSLVVSRGGVDRRDVGGRCDAMFVCSCNVKLCVNK
jgi:hypothetical protein